MASIEFEKMFAKAKASKDPTELLVAIQEYKKWFDTNLSYPTTSRAAVRLAIELVEHFTERVKAVEHTLHNFVVISAQHPGKRVGVPARKLPLKKFLKQAIKPKPVKVPAKKKASKR